VDISVWGEYAASICKVIVVAASSSGTPKSICTSAWYHNSDNHSL